MKTMAENSGDTKKSSATAAQKMAEEKSVREMNDKLQASECGKPVEKIAGENEEKPQASELQEGKKEKRKSGKGRLLAFMLLGVILLALACVYVGGIFYYRTHFLPGTSMNNVDISGLNRAQVCSIMENRLHEYSLKIVGRDVNTTQSGAALGTIAATDIALTYSDNMVAVEKILQQQERLLWPYIVLSGQKREVATSQGIAYDRGLLCSVLENWEACRAENMIAPKDAYIDGYSEEVGGYGITPETLGTELDMETVIQLVEAAVMELTPTLDIEAAGCYSEAAVTREDEQLVGAVEAANRMLKAQITYDWNGAEVVLGGELLREWVSIEENKAVLDEDAVKAFVKEQAESHDTYGKPRNFLTTLGIELTLPSGYYGWQTDREAECKELVKLIREGSVVTKEPAYSSTAKKKGMSDIGTSYVEADLTHQHLYLYQDGVIVFETDFVSGSMSSTPDCVTPQGVFGLSYKTTNAVLRGANYVTPVSYWMPFYGNYGMHDATWRSEFGGDIYLTDGSHGCLNLPLDSAAVLYQYVSTGFPIICYYYPVDPLAAQTDAEAEWEGAEE